MMRAFFLSASVPDPRRNPKYHGTADIIAIRDAVRALATVVLPHASITWGGHPAITPLIRVVAESVGIVQADRVRLYQSAWFSDVLPSDNAAFERYQLTAKRETQDASLYAMRQEMIGSQKFEAGIFIGGMEGVEDEYHMFSKTHPNARLLPVKTTGAAAGLLFDKEAGPRSFSPELATEYAYPTLFRRLLDLPSRG